MKLNLAEGQTKLHVLFLLVSLSNALANQSAYTTIFVPMLCRRLSSAASGLLAHAFSCGVWWEPGLEYYSIGLLVHAFVLMRAVGRAAWETHAN
jgi:hypothetical protein